MSASRITSILCRHCRTTNGPSWRRRGLCRDCHRNIKIRNKYAQIVVCGLGAVSNDCNGNRPLPKGRLPDDRAERLKALAKRYQKRTSLFRPEERSTRC